MAGTTDGSRVVHWRWLEAQALIDEGRPVSSRKLDPFVFHAYQFLRERRPRTRADGQVESVGAADRRASRLFPEMGKAERIFTKVNNNDAVRWLLEALVLANEDPQSIYEYMGVDPRTIQVYEEVFFDIRSRLHMPGCVQILCFGQMSSTELPVHDPDRAWKYLGYHGKRRLLEYFLTLSPGNTEELNVVRKLVHSQMGKVALRSASSAPIIAETAVPNIQAFQAIDEQARNAPPSNRHMDELEQSISMLNGAITLSLNTVQAGSKIAIEPHVPNVVKRLTTGKPETPVSTTAGAEHG